MTDDTRGRRVEEVTRWDMYICACVLGTHIEHVKNATGQYVDYDDHVKALADAERRGMERAAKIVEERINRQRGNSELRTAFFLRKDEGEWILSAIRAQAQAGEVG